MCYGWLRRRKCLDKCKMRNAKCKIKNGYMYMTRRKPLFIPFAEKNEGSSAYYEFQYCKRDLTVEQAVKPTTWSHWAEDSLLVHMDGEHELFCNYIKPYMSAPHAPNGSRVYFYAGVNYYTREEATEMLDRLRIDRPVGCEALIPWLERAANEFYGFYIMGV